VRDIISVLRTNSNLIEFVRVTSFTNAAARVPEPTSATDDAALKPESSIALEIVQATVKTIAHFFAITRQILSDAPQLQTIIDTFGRDGLELVLEEKIINGAGGADFLGLDNTPGLTQQAFDTSLLVTTRKARTKVKYTGRATPTAYILNPIDWETLDLTVDNEARYYFGGPMVLGTPRLWGLPVVECEPVRQGTGYVGDMKQAVLWDRESATMHITDSNRDWFERNILAILFELRAAFGVLRPAAIVRMDLHAGANS
jgi:HK97 family phage major capsid protein